MTIVIAMVVFKRNMNVTPYNSMDKLDKLIKDLQPRQTKGDRLLIQDLQELLAEAMKGEFGDFTNKKYDAPKMALRFKLLELADNVMYGKYD